MITPLETKRGLTETREQSLSKLIVNIHGYEGNSGRIKGFRRIQETIEAIPGIETVTPLILTAPMYDFYKSGSRDHIALAADYIFNSLDASKHPLIVRRLFPDKKGDAQNGPRSANINTLDQLRDSILEFYEYYGTHYSPDEVAPEIMVHRVIDVSNPMKDEAVGLPYPGGDVIQLSEDTFQVRATFGADESVQGHPSDVWQVVYKGDKKMVVTQIESADKTTSLIPSTDNYREISLPKDHQQDLALTLLQVTSLAEACRRMSKRFGPHRLEFDGTRTDYRDKLVIIEAAPFALEKQVLKSPISGFVHIFENEEDFKNLKPDSTSIVHLSSEYFQGNHKREALTRLSSIASEKNARLIVLASGNIATQHAARVLIDSGNIVLFVGDERFRKNEEVEVYSQDGEISWKRSNPVSHKGELSGKKADKIGGKVVGLQKLEQYGFDTPNFAVIETSFMRSLLEDLNLLPDVESLDTLPIEQAEITAEAISKKIRDYKGRLVRQLGMHVLYIADRLKVDKFAVRSSATCEDGDFSFAGIFETKLGVETQDIVTSVLEVIASCFSSQAIRTARSLNFNPSALGMAVIIQEMIEAKHAGTIFTKDSLSDNREVLKIEATSGSGNSIVEGSAQEFQVLVVNKATGRILKDEVYNASMTVLTDEEKQKLIQVGIAIEDKLREGPQDIEWAINERGKLLILQTRSL